MVNVCKILKDDIEKITIEHIILAKQDVKRDLKYAYWQELITESQYNDLLEYLEEHCNKVFDEYFNRSYEIYMRSLDLVIRSKK